MARMELIGNPNAKMTTDQACGRAMILQNRAARVVGEVREILAALAALDAEMKKAGIGPIEPALADVRRVLRDGLATVGGRA